MVIVGFFAIGLHEYAHCKFADMAGDPTPSAYGRVTLNLFKHFEVTGTIMMLITATTGYGIGWGRPAPMDPRKMRDPRWDFFLAVAAGPLSNVIQAIAWALIGRILLSAGALHSDSVLAFLESAGGGGQFGADAVLSGLVFYGVFLNLSLALFNLFPLGPLDGHWLLGLLMPERPRDKWFWWNGRYGWFLLIGAVLLGQFVPALSIFRIASPVINFAAIKLLGPLLGLQ
jgi:Zn-dependent protease